MIIKEEASEQTTNRRSKRVGPASDVPATQSLDVLAALLRYKWAVVLPAIVGGVLGFLIYLKTDETYRSSTKLMVESNRPPMFDALTGEVVGGVPDIEVLEAQLYSDKVAEMAFNDPNMQPYHDLYNNNLVEFSMLVQEQLELEPEVTDLNTAQSLITHLHFDSHSAEHCEAAIHAYSRALQDYYDQRHKSTQAELTRLIETAIKSINPKLEDLEKNYANFRHNSGLSWDAEGVAHNPHREQQKYLVTLRAKTFEELSREQTVFESMKSVAKQMKDPRIALNVMSQLLGVKVSPLEDSRRRNVTEGDSMLAEIDLEKKLLPLIVARNQNEREFGPEHPSVKAYDDELQTTRDELTRLVREQADRIASLYREFDEDMGDPTERAKETVQAVLYSHEAKVHNLEQYIKELDEQIATEKALAASITQDEIENEQKQAEIQRYRDLLHQLEDNMGRAKLSDEESITQIVELWAPTKAYLVGPSILKLGGIGTLLGLMLGSGLAMLLEKNADTFRSPDEISNQLGVAVLAHIPFFRARRRKVKKDEEDPFKSLSTDVAVVHQPSSIASESVRSLRTAVFFDTSKMKRGKVIQVTSPLPGDGKSTVASNLACSIAQSGKRVLTIDCDLRRPQLTDNFDSADKLGLTNVLNGECDPLDAAHATPVPKLSVMPCGPIPSNPAEALSLPQMNELLDLLRDHFDFIVLDTPPLLVVTDPSITASMADALILTLRVRRKSKPNATEAINILNGVGANVLGVVINNSDENSSADGYKGYGYYRYGRYGGQYYRRRGKGTGTSVTVSDEAPLRLTRAISASVSTGAKQPSSTNGRSVKKDAPPPPLPGAQSINPVGGDVAASDD